MMNRRQFCCAAAAGAAMLARIPTRVRGDLRSGHQGRARHRSLGWARRDPRRGDRRRPHRGGRGQHCGRRHRNDRCARQDRRARPDRHPHPRRPQQGRAADVPAGRRDRLGRCRLGRSGQHRSNRRRPRGQRRKSAAPWSTLRAPGSPPAANCTTSIAPTWPWRGAPSPAIAMSSSASRRACRTTSPAPTISRRCGARRRRPRPSICR